MTQTELTGEQREAKRRRNFWLMMTVFFVGGIVSGIFSGILDTNEGIKLDPIWVITFIVIALAAFIWMSIIFFRRVDELEMADNLWGGLIGIYFYFAAQPVWYLLHHADMVEPIAPWPIYFATISVTFAAYLGRKILNR